MFENISISTSSLFSASNLDSSFIVFFGIITPGISVLILLVSELEVANRWPSVPTNVKALLLSRLDILKYKPFKKYLVSSFDIANFVLLIRLKNFVF